MFKRASLFFISLFIDYAACFQSISVENYNLHHASLKLRQARPISGLLDSNEGMPIDAHPSTDVSNSHASQTKQAGIFERRHFLSLATRGLAASVVLGMIPNPGEAKPMRVKDAPRVDIGEKGAQFQDMTIGDGPEPKAGDRVVVHFSLFCKGIEIESTRDSQGLAARPYGFDFLVDGGAPRLPGIVPSALQGMRVGGRRKIYLPADEAFGEKGYPPLIPPNTPVTYDISLWSVKPAGTNPNVTKFGQSFIP
uniref:peptidylprolyl isomerase n=1 Tax=Fibrocapsa japonica TaxID=94617 RepID=A0A7S2V053_9STRA|mmetsp:Transcript_22771/g.33046  ORF Transcript_22771/g.33046 Transcript_22771/m.33046 type:complete len:252 (+) Transcript_22771:73-828(+)